MTGSIRTPDQRLRVFISSTLKELAPERRVARAAAERLHLAPVMFELGARPHAPRDLYRAYLAQSDVFVGLYAERYGWVAPGEEVSGLEDEYNLAPRHLPKLIYIKDPVDEREPRLVELLDRVRTDDTASFKYYSSVREFGQLLENDLATLLAERFDASRTAAAPPSADELPPAETPRQSSEISLPTQLTELIGRDAEVHRLDALLRRDSARFITLTGPGGIGKSRLAVAAASRAADHFPGGVVFVDLAPVHDPALVVNAIAAALGVRDPGDAPLVEKLTTAIRTRRLLLVLDNVEQVLGAAPLFVDLLRAAPGLTLLLTSRALVRVSAEQSVEVGPLALPTLGRGLTVADVLAAPSVALFVERAHAVRPDFEVTPENVEAVARICVALDGVPLALELAAARIRVLTPAAMLERHERGLPLPVWGMRDLPERQQTLRNTIEWSTGLLGESEKNLLFMLGVFEGGFSLEAAEAVGGDDALGNLAVLVDNSLVRQQDLRERSYFTMLASVREYALERLEENGTLAATRERHAAFFIESGRDIEIAIEGHRQRELVQQLREDTPNLRATVRYLLDRREWDRAAEFAWYLYLYWWIGGLLGEVRGWMDVPLSSGDELRDETRAIALYFTRAITFWQDPAVVVVAGLTESAELFEREQNPAGEALARVSLALAMLADDPPDPARADDELETSLTLFRESDDAWGESLVLVSLGRVALLQNQLHRAINRFDEGLAITRRERDSLGETIALHHLGWAKLLGGDLGAARGLFARSVTLAAELGHEEGIAYGLEGLVAVVATEGDVDRAGRLLGAADRLREERGIFNAAAFSFHRGIVERILAGDRAGEFATARVLGRELSAEDAVAEALSDAPPAAVTVSRPSSGALE
ncbi:putative ATPase [Conyzicola lurida]|uniref:Putative ATPase n=1 Tax=Conyzicola lurida TaxID=1172621 RepID=A0A841AI44_9MICO|nr:DUF4062 domain-containing protein [Conyzicola lurida]MBB5842907.1 putative ATPase [Conyzicola lurida]